jgi:hypothetical protein
MTRREPHVRRVYLPPEEPEPDSLAEVFLGLAGVCLFFVTFFILLAWAS